MFHSKQMIEMLGYMSVDEFVKDYVMEHNNCCIRYTPNGVWLDYDFDSQLGICNLGYKV